MIWFKVNPLGILLAAAAYLLMGAFFYSQWGLGRFWTTLTKHMQKEADHATAKVYLGAFACALLIAYAMGCLMNLLQTKTFSSGIMIGFLGWLGFVLPTTFSPVLFGKKPIEMFWLDAIYYLIAYLVMGAIIARLN